MISRLFDFLSRRIDGPLMAALALTLALGLTVVYSASGGGSVDRVMGQGRNLMVAFLALTGVSQWLSARPAGCSRAVKRCSTESAMASAVSSSPASQRPSARTRFMRAASDLAGHQAGRW